MTTERGFVIALLGAESTGKTTLAIALRAALVAEGREAVVVPEYLREFCDREQRTPRPVEQRAIADEQTRRIEAAAIAHRCVIADTTALMIAVYSDQVFSDTGLYAHAQAARGQRIADLAGHCRLAGALGTEQGDDEGARHDRATSTRGNRSQARQPTAAIAVKIA